MPVVNDVKKEIRNDAKAAKKWRLPWWAILGVIAGSLPIYSLLDHFGRINLALPTLVIGWTLGVAMAVTWRLRRNAWFWLTMTTIAALHVPLILFVPWSTKWVPAIVIIPVAGADYYGTLRILSAVGGFAERRRLPADSRDAP
jgi:hypothetical protein